MELTEYQELVSFISSNYSVFAAHLQDHSSKLEKNKRDNYKAKAKKFFVKDDELYRYVPGLINGAKVVIKGTENDVLVEFHGSPFGGHSGVNRTTEAIQKRYWWKGLTEDVKAYVRSCAACQKSDPLKPAKKPELQQIKVSSPFELVGVDLIGPFTTTNHGHQYIFTATDYYTKWVEAFPIPSKQATDVAKCFQKLFSRHGAVKAILTDQGREFVNSLNDQLCKDWNIKHKVTAAYHPQTNGLDERTNQTLKTTLRKLVNEHQTDWDDYIDAALFAQRTKPQTSTKYSPFFLLYGREAVYPSQLPKDFDIENHDITAEPEEIDSFVKQRKKNMDATTAKVSVNVTRAQERQRTDYNKRSQKRRQFDALSVGDVVLRFNAKKATTKRKGNLEPTYEGPYTIIDIVGKKATLKNQSGTVLKSKCNTDRLKLFRQAASPTTEPMSAMPDLTSTMTESTTHNSATTEHNSTTASAPAQPAAEQLLQLEVDQYITEIQNNNTLQQLIDFASKLKVVRPTNMINFNRLMEECPVQSFILEVTREFEEKMELFGRGVLPSLRNLPITLTEKTTVAMIVSAVCCKAAELYQPATTIAETLVQKPGHMLQFEDAPAIGPSVRLSVGGETVEATDLGTLDNGQWLNDKVINAFLGLLKAQVNTTESRIFILPSYTAVLWDAGNLGHWLFKTVQFLKFNYVLLPINVDNSHWVLLVANTKDRTITIIDSLNAKRAEKFLDLWSQHMQIRDESPDTKEVTGSWTVTETVANKQTDGHSCGVFVLMNAECIANNLPVQIMRQVHCQLYRGYVKARIVSIGVSKKEDMCDMPECCAKKGTQRWIQCCVCGRWFHTKCSKISAKAALDEEFECVFCFAMYN